ncbi:MAG: DUF1838 domain-containing protein [Gammaproteobacteria bacterium]|nr:MAG: DUF1838 domain-containing protein [Gammaproteobacteria bacterium]
MLYSSQLRALMNRRSMLNAMLGAGAAASAVPLLSACAQENALLASAGDGQAEPGPVPRTIDFSDPAQNLHAFIKVMGSLDPEQEVVGWFGGDIFAVTSPDKPLQKLFGVEGMGVLRTEAQPDGSYRIFNRECAFYTDPRTGEYMDRWTNPFHGEEVKVVPIHNLVVNAEIAPIFKMDFDGRVQEIPFTPPWWVQEKIDKAMNMFEVHVVAPNPMSVEEWPRESAGPVNRISEMFHRTAKLSELQDDSLDSVDYSGVWTRIGPWLPWMLQGQMPGHLLYRTFMTKPMSIDRMPDKLVKHVAERLGEQYFRAPPPETWGSQNDSSFSVYMRENEPAPPR